MKTTRKYNSRQIFNKQVIISILLIAILGVWNSARAQVENQDLTKEQLNISLAVDSEDEMVIEDWMLDPAYWEKVLEEIEKKYHKLIVQEDPEPELEVEPWMLNFHYEILNSNYYVAEDEQEVEDWMLDLTQFQTVIRVLAEK